MSSPGCPPRRPSIKKREGAAPGSVLDEAQPLGFQAGLPQSAQAVSASRSGLWTRQKLPPHRSR